MNLTETIHDKELIPYATNDEVAGSEALIRTLINESVDVIFGYPGGGNMPIYDSLFDHLSEIKHVLTRHEQGAIHAAQGYAGVTDKPGVVFVTSGPGATNIITGLTDAMADSTPLVCIAGQIGANLLGTDAFQEADIVALTLPVTKWNYRVTDAREIPQIISKAFYIATTGRPGPVVISITKSAQFEKIKFNFDKCVNVSGYEPFKYPEIKKIEKAVCIIKAAKRPLLIFGNGVKISKAQKELKAFIEKTGIPAAWTIMGVSALPTDHPLNMGMMGMHGNFAPNRMVEVCDVLIAVGMRFDDRVTGNPKKFATNAKIIHIDIDSSEIDKVVKTFHSINSDAKVVLQTLTNLVSKNNFKYWISQFKNEINIEKSLVKDKDFNSSDNDITMAEVVNEINSFTKGNAVIVTDVGQHQMIVSRYIKIAEKGKLITSGGLGTMGFGLPAAVGAVIGNCNEDPVIAVVGDGGIQMTIQELGTVMQENLNLKIIILNNNFLGMVRQWQELFFNKRYSFTEIESPNFQKIADAYNIENNLVSNKSDLKNAINKMLKHKGAYLLEVKVAKEGNVFPIIPSGLNVADTKFEN